jgi:hypothetical protein
MDRRKRYDESAKGKARREAERKRRNSDEYREFHRFELAGRRLATRIREGRI